MRLDQLQASLRERNAFEAIDLGFAMARRWWRPLWGAWAVTALPAMLLIWVVLHNYPLAAVLLTWWLKPLWARVPLYVLSRALFGAAPAPRDVLKAGLWRRDLPASLLLYRLSPARGFLAPVGELENLRGEARRRRRMVLGGQTAGSAMLLTGVCMLLEGVVWSGLVGLVFVMLPDTASWQLGAVLSNVLEAETPAWLALTLAGAWILALSLVEPLYVAGSFGLYLNRRTWLEGWDIELAFRRLAARLTAPAALLLALALGIPAANADTGAPPAPAAAEEPARDPAEVMAEVLADPDFGGKETRSRWQLRWQIEPEERALPRVELGWLDQLVRAILVVLGAALAVLLLLRLRGMSLLARPAPRPRPLPAPEQGAGPEPPEELPDDVIGAARARWAAGQPTAALGLLYRGAVAHLVSARRLEIPEAATEGESLSVARARLDEPIRADFAALTGAWVRAAYAHRPPTAETFAQLCQRWQAHLGGGA